MMQTDDLIARLAAQSAPAPLQTGRLGVAMAACIFGAIGVFLLILGTRPDLRLAWSNPVVPLKTILPLVIFVPSLLLVLRLLRPEARVGATRWGYAVPALVALALWIGAFALRSPETRFDDISAFSLAECLGSILLVSILPVAALLRLVRRGAAASPMLCGALVGLTVASGVTTGYSLFCTRDNPLFFVTWYGIAMLIVTLTSAALGRRMLKW